MALVCLCVSLFSFIIHSKAFWNSGIVYPQAKSVLGWMSSKVTFYAGILGWPSKIGHLTAGGPPEGWIIKKAIIYNGFDCPPTQGHLAMSGDIFDVPEWGMLLASCGLKPGILLSTQQCTGQTSTAKSDLGQSVHSTKVEKSLCFPNMGARPRRCIQAPIRSCFTRHLGHLKGPHTNFVVRESFPLMLFCLFVTGSWEQRGGVIQHKKWNQRPLREESLKQLLY